MISFSLDELTQNLGVLNLLLMEPKALVFILVWRNFNFVLSRLSLQFLRDVVNHLVSEARVHAKVGTNHRT